MNTLESLIYSKLEWRVSCGGSNYEEVSGVKLDKHKGIFECSILSSIGFMVNYFDGCFLDALRRVFKEILRTN